jgi:hypothetical protein
MPPRRLKSHQYAVCVRNAGFEASFEVRKLYPVLDESGEDYIYPAHLFQRLTLPAEIQRALRLAS